MEDMNTNVNVNENTEGTSTEDSAVKTYTQDEVLKLLQTI